MFKYNAQIMCVFFLLLSLLLSLLIFKGFQGLENWISKLMDFHSLRKRILRLKHFHGFGKQLSKHKDFLKALKVAFKTQGLSSTLRV